LSDFCPKISCNSSILFLPSIVTAPHMTLANHTTVTKLSNHVEAVQKSRIAGILQLQGRGVIT
jgi:5,10-methylenetetrahydrofolate reductase